MISIFASLPIIQTKATSLRTISNNRQTFRSSKTKVKPLLENCDAFFLQ